MRRDWWIDKRGNTRYKDTYVQGGRMVPGTPAPVSQSHPPAPPQKKEEED